MGLISGWVFLLSACTVSYSCLRDSSPVTYPGGLKSSTQQSRHYNNGIPPSIFYQEADPISAHLFLLPLASICFYHWLLLLVQLLSYLQMSATPWTAARQASLSVTNSRSLLKLMPIESVMPSNHLILCHPLLLPPGIVPSIRVFSNESALHHRWAKDWSFSLSISPSNEYSGLISFRTDWFDVLPNLPTL